MPLIRRDGKTDLCAPRYLALDQQLSDFAQLEEEIDIKISDLGAGKQASDVTRKQNSAVF
jgi:hypothetical protein